MTEIELQNNTYRIGKLDAFKQLHVSRKIAPIIPTLIPIFVSLSKEGAKADDLGSMADILGPFADGIASMKDSDAEYVLSTCLSAVQRRSADGVAYVPVWAAQQNVSRFDDMDLGVMLQLTVRVIQESLSSFISGLLMSQQGSPTTTTAPVSLA